jgi:hypothetical protein
MTHSRPLLQEADCPLCASSGEFLRISGPKERQYLVCANCQLIFMDRALLPDPLTEKTRYQAHQNSAQNEGYVRFLNQAISPTLPYLHAKMQGLDYGCGPTPTLSVLLGEHGLSCENYDPYFFPTLTEKHYDFIFATEVIEHFFHPASEFIRLKALLKPEGMLTLMTEQWHDLKGFSTWHYAKDITHVCFYHANTIAYLCENFGFTRLNPASPNVSVLKNNAALKAPTL